MAGSPRRVEASLVDAVKERAERIIVRLADRIVLVIMAPGAAYGEAQEGAADEFASFGHVLDTVLLVDDAVLRAALAQSPERGGKKLFPGRVRQQVARELPARELVVGHVLVECFDDPVAPGPEETIMEIVEKTVGLRIARHVEPFGCHPFTVARRFQQLVDEPLEGIWTGIRDKRIDLIECRRQTRQTQCGAIDQSLPVRLGGGCEACRIQPGEHVVINGVARRVVKGCFFGLACPRRE